ncbi:hypothetical protein CEXT_199501 [Caerostris extrusa]|uniref:Uncharacterized protein n=1 Tax=Caerostris extrusa TaxID=172846 RepID=A0AAV4U975_CAEEX|nr:hypothetical protein CEXT_199501 [Caerostris extrusa]
MELRIFHKLSPPRAENFPGELKGGEEKIDLSLFQEQTSPEAENFSQGELKGRGEDRSIVVSGADPESLNLKADAESLGCSIFIASCGFCYLYMALPPSSSRAFRGIFH